MSTLNNILQKRCENIRNKEICQHWKTSIVHEYQYIIIATLSLSHAHATQVTRTEADPY